MNQCFSDTCFWCENSNSTACYAKDTRWICLESGGILIDGGSTEECKRRKTQMITVVLCITLIPCTVAICFVGIYFLFPFRNRLSFLEQTKE
jgi:hypothetical protein